MNGGVPKEKEPIRNSEIVSRTEFAFVSGSSFEISKLRLVVSSGRPKVYHYNTWILTTTFVIVRKEQ